MFVFLCVPQALIGAPMDFLKPRFSLGCYLDPAQESQSDEWRVMDRDEGPLCNLSRRIVLMRGGNVVVASPAESHTSGCEL